MAHFYGKVNPIVAKEMEITDKKNLRLPDGNFLAYINHFARFCPLYEIRDMAPRLGCLLLTPKEMKEELDGKFNRPLPVATDPRYRVAEAPKEEVEEFQEPEPEPTPAQEPEPPQEEGTQEDIAQMENVEPQEESQPEEEDPEPEEEEEEGGVE